MNRAVFVTTWREFRHNKVRCIILTLLFLLPLALFTFVRVEASFNSYMRSTCFETDMLTPSWIAMVYTLLWSVGVIGREVQNGTIGLVFARPITIANYVCSKWLAVSIAASVCAVQACVTEHLISSVFCPQLLFTPEFAINCGERVILCFGLASFLILLSSLVSGLKDIAVLAGLGLLFGLNFLISSILDSFLARMDATLPSKVGHYINGFLSFFNGIFLALFYPALDLRPILSMNMLYLPNVINYLALVTTCLACSVWIMTRKEFSYAAD
jgi:ABC-type transport system involved in multi-copper enzyme maturation permease subunit